MIEIYEGDDRADNELVRACKSGDVAAFAVLYRRYAPTVMRYSWSRLNDRAQAEDVVQETFTTAWAKLRTANLIDESLLPWVLAIAGNHTRNQLRRNIKHRAVGLSDAESSAADPSTLVPTSDLIAIESALSSLSPTDRLVCELCLIDGFSYAEAAQMVGTTASAVRNRLHRSRARLRDLLADD